jgi:hypothetical protein
MEAAMKAWRALENGQLELQDLPAPQAAPGTIVARMQAAPVLSYLRQVLDGSLGFDTPQRPFTPGTNGVAVVESVGAGVYHLKPGQRVALDPHLVADERVADPAQILVGLTAMPGGAPPKALQAAWPNGFYAEMAHLPAQLATPGPLRSTPCRPLSLPRSPNSPCRSAAFFVSICKRARRSSSMARLGISAALERSSRSLSAPDGSSPPSVTPQRWTIPPAWRARGSSPSRSRAKPAATPMR